MAEWRSEEAKRAARASNAARQKAYRERVRDDVSGEWLKTVIDLHAKRSLERLARHYGVTRRAALERMIREAEIAVLESLDPLEQGQYYKD